MHALRFAAFLMCLAPLAASATDTSSTPLPAGSAQPSTGVPLQPNVTMKAEVSEPNVAHMRAIFAGIGAQSRRDEIELRHDLLGILTPAQRTWVAQMIGGLAVAPNPDAADAARRIDAALSPNQRQAVAQYMQAAAARVQAAFAQAFAQSQRDMAAQLPANGSVLLQGGGAHVVGGPPPGAFDPLRNQSAGTLLLEILTTGTLESLHPLMQPTLMQPTLIQGPP